MGRKRPPPHTVGRSTPPHRWRGAAPPAFQATSPHGGEELPLRPFRPPPHTVGRRGRLGQAGGWGSCCWVVGCDAGRGSACLSLGRGTQRAETLATICCVPSQVITPNVVAVKTIE